VIFHAHAICEWLLALSPIPFIANKMSNRQVAASQYESIKQEEAPKLLTTSKLLAVFFVQLNEAYQISVLLPIVVFMCRDFGIEPAWLGVYSSILNATFGFCQFLVSYMWGYLSDVYGRRNILICGLMGTFFAMTAFGFSTSFVMAMVCRCFTGFFNGNLGVVKAYLGDITDSSNRGAAFSVLGVSFGFGIVLGSLLGGILIVTNDVDVPDDEYIKTTSVFAYSIFKEDFPFLLPTSVCGGFVSINSLLWTYLFIKDERKTKRPAAIPDDDMNSALSVDTIEMASNLTSNSLRYGKMAASEEAEHGTGSKSYYRLKAEYMTSPMHQSLPTYQEFAAMATKLEPDRVKLLSQLRESRADDIYYDTADNNANAISTVSDIFKKTLFGHALLQYGTAAISHMMFKEMGPVYMAQALLFDSMYIGYTQALSGVVLFIFTLLVQPFCLKRFPHKVITVLCAFSTALCMLAFPSIYWFTLIKNERFEYMTSGVWLLGMAMFVEFLITQVVSIVFVVATCWLNNSVPPTCLGKANGIGQTCAAFVRGFGPLMTGFIWSESFMQIEEGMHYAVYYAYLPGAIFYLIAVVDILAFIPFDLQKTWEQREHDKPEK